MSEPQPVARKWYRVFCDPYDSTYRVEELDLDKWVDIKTEVAETRSATYYVDVLIRSDAEALAVGMDMIQQYRNMEDGE